MPQDKKPMDSPLKDNLTVKNLSGKLSQFKNKGFRRSGDTSKVCPYRLICSIGSSE